MTLTTRAAAYRSVPAWTGRTPCRILSWYRCRRKRNRRKCSKDTYSNVTSSRGSNRVYCCSLDCFFFYAAASLACCCMFRRYLATVFHVYMHMHMQFTTQQYCTSICFGHVTLSLCAYMCYKLFLQCYVQTHTLHLTLHALLIFPVMI